MIIEMDTHLTTSASSRVQLGYAHSSPKRWVRIELYTHSFDLQSDRGQSRAFNFTSKSSCFVPPKA